MFKVDNVIPLWKVVIPNMNDTSTAEVTYEVRFRFIIQSLVPCLVLSLVGFFINR